MRDGVHTVLRSYRDIRVVEVVGWGRKAVEEALQLKPDVVVTGGSIPVMEGIELTRAIVERKPDAAVLVIVARESASLIQQVFRAGARGCLLKESPPGELAKAVRAVARGRRYLGPGVADKVFDSFQAPRRDLEVLDRLTTTEREILRLVAEGKSNARTADVLRLSPRTAETYRASLMRKVELGDLPSLVKFAIRHGITGLD